MGARGFETSDLFRVKQIETSSESVGDGPGSPEPQVSPSLLSSLDSNDRRLVPPFRQLFVNADPAASPSGGRLFPHCGERRDQEGRAASSRARLRRAPETCAELSCGRSEARHTRTAGTANSVGLLDQTLTTPSRDARAQTARRRRPFDAPRALAKAGGSVTLALLKGFMFRDGRSGPADRRADSGS